MRRRRQLLPQADTVEMLRSGTSGVLAVHGDDGYPYAVPMSFVLDDGKLYLHSAVSGHKLDAIERSDKVSFCVIGGDDVVQSEFTTHFRSVIVFGRARVLTEPEEKRRALRLLAEKYSPDHVGAAGAEIEGAWDRTCAVVIDIEHATGKAAIEIVTGKS